MYKLPILLISFNRPDFTEQVLERIREIKPNRLYLFRDGPRNNNQSDVLQTNEVKKVLETIDWPCDVKRNYSEDNLGCKNGVSTAINWFFENEKMGIILEDDCLPTANFFEFMDVLLHKFEKNEEIMHISGTSFDRADQNQILTYSACNIPHVWGWGSWRRSWAKYSNKFDKKDLNELDILLNKYFKNNNVIKKYWKKTFNNLLQNKIDTWDYQWTYTIWKNKGVCINPSVTMIENIGFDNRATHTIVEKHINDPIQDTLELKHPPLLETAPETNARIMNDNFIPSFKEKITDFILRKIR